MTLQTLNVNMNESNINNLSIIDITAEITENKIVNSDHDEGNYANIKYFLNIEKSFLDTFLLLYFYINK